MSAGRILVVDFANTFVFQFAHGYHMTASSDLGITLLQPLLRNDRGVHVFGWWRGLRSGDWHDYYARQYADRLATSSAAD